jgi:hypothetical protein
MQKHLANPLIIVKATTSTSQRVHPARRKRDVVNDGVN